jgi:hypothetical protein
MTRDEHLSWAKERAHEYADKGQLDQAVNSMGSDLGKHEELKVNNYVLAYGILLARRKNYDGVKSWIDGFR